MLNAQGMGTASFLVPRAALKRYSVQPDPPPQPRAGGCAQKIKRKS